MGARTLWLRRIGIGVGALVAVLIVAVAALYVWLGTDGGRRFVSGQVRALAFENGMRIGLDGIDGSIFGAMTVRRLTISDPQGVFLSADRVDLDWRPFAYARKHLDIRALVIPTARLARLPAFKATPPSEGPLLPDIDIDVGRLSAGRLQIDAAVTGQRHLVSLDGAVHIADRRAEVRAKAAALTGPGVAGGDRVALLLDAVPDRNRLAMDLRVDAPANGLIAGYSGVRRPLSLALNGKGDWAAWAGRLAGSAGADRLADVAITARNGIFTVKGPVRPGLFLTGPGRNMVEPVTLINLTAAMQANRRVAIDGGAGSDNFTFAARGLLDLGRSSMEGLRLDFRLLKPSVIAKNLTGDAIAATATLDGKFVAPSLSYAVTARRAGFGATGVEGLSVSGSAALDKDQWRIPVRGAARRITGMNEGIGALLTNVALDGDFAYARGRLLSDNLRLRSDRIDAKAIVVADMTKALYTGALQGTVNGYRVDSIGIFNLTTNMDLKTGANGTFRLGGRVMARSTRLLNDGMRSFLGGNALIAADVGYDSNGMATVDRLSIAAPAFRMTGGMARYDAAGRVRFIGRGSSNAYGPLAVDVSGTVARPLVRIAAARPGLGVGLANVTAIVRGENGRYAATGKGESDYGGFEANMLVATGPLRIDVRPGTQFGGIGLTGHVAQGAAGPFTGTLAADGSGITGLVQLSSVSGKQRAVVHATAQHASLPGKVGLSADRAILNADILLAQQPQVGADVQVAGVRSGSLAIAAARASVNYREGRGQAKLLVEGRTRYPFRMAANALLDPGLWRVALKGRFNGIDVATPEALRIVPEKGAYILLPGTIDTGQGHLQLTGHYGRGMALSARLDGVNLALANPFAPGLGLGGTASGSLDFAQPSPATFPTADARLQIRDFTRTSLASVSQPVDMQILGRLESTGGHAGAIIRRRGTAIGRMQVALQPLGPGAGAWTSRLMAAPLSGGIRYNGPADTLFSLAALADQSLKGAIGVAADFGGRADAPQLTGVVRASNLTYENATYGTKLTNMVVDGRFTNDRLQVEKLTARAGDGTISASGFVSLSSAQGFPVQLGIAMDRARLASGQDLSAEASGQLRIVNGPGQSPTVSGTITLPETRYRIVRQGSAKVPTLTGIRRKPALGRERITGNAEAMASLPSAWKLDIAVRAPNKLYVSGMGLDAEWAADLHVGGTSGAPVITGGVQAVRGTLGFAGHSFDIDNTSTIHFNGGAMTDPELNIRASGDVNDVTITIAITGTGENPQIAFSSSPSLPQDELMARILFGNSVGELSAIQAVQLAASLNALRGGKGGLNPLGVLQSSTGIDRLRILGDDKTTGRGTAVAVGQYITNDVYVEVVTDARGYTATQLEISLSRALSLLSEMGSFGGSSVNLRYRRNY